MKVLFIGGTGLISQAVSRLAVAHNVELFLLNRGQHTVFAPEGVQEIHADIRDVAACQSVLQEHQFDVVVDWIAYTKEHVEADIQLFRGKVGQYIFISSASAYQKPPTHYLVTESTPLANPFWQYSRDKIACEEHLMQAYREMGFPVTIVRPSFTYGNTMIPAALNSSKHPWSLVYRMKQGFKTVIHGDGTSLWTMTHNTDFARGFLGLMGNALTVGHAFHITSDEVLNWNQIHETIAAAAGVEASTLHIASDFIAEQIPELRGGLLGDKSISYVFDNSKIKKFVPGFQATVSFAEGMRRTLQWFSEHPEYQVVDEEWNHQMDSLIAAYESRSQNRA
jgi:nucleoside-diphosphate-sugar epimerase